MSTTESSVTIFTPLKATITDETALLLFLKNRITDYDREIGIDPEFDDYNLLVLAQAFAEQSTNFIDAVACERSILHYLLRNPKHGRRRLDGMDPLILEALQLTQTTINKLKIGSKDYNCCGFILHVDYGQVNSVSCIPWLAAHDPRLAQTFINLYLRPIDTGLWIDKCPYHLLKTPEVKFLDTNQKELDPTCTVAPLPMDVICQIIYDCPDSLLANGFEIKYCRQRPNLDEIITKTTLTSFVAKYWTDLNDVAKYFGFIGTLPEIGFDKKHISYLKHAIRRMPDFDDDLFDDWTSRNKKTYALVEKDLKADKIQAMVNELLDSNSDAVELEHKVNMIKQLALTPPKYEHF